jgi:hypothetical protein
MRLYGITINKHRQWQLTVYFISNTTKVILISYYMNSITEVLDFKNFRGGMPPNRPPLGRSRRETRTVRFVTNDV